MARERRRRRRRRDSGTGPGAPDGPAQLAPRQVRNRFPPISVFDPDELDKLHIASLRVLEEVGMDFLHPEALDILARGGAEVDRETCRVRLDRGLVEQAISTAPAEFALGSRNPERRLVFGGNAVNFGSVASAPYCSDLDGGRRAGSFDDFCNLLRLVQSLNIVHLSSGYPVEPQDLPPETRHLDCIRAFVTLTDKPYHAYSLGRTRMLDAIELTKIARGLDDDGLMREPSLFSVVNTSSPLRLDGPMIEGVIELARRNQPVAITPFTLSGAMSPVTLAGALVQQNAEALAGIAFVQMVNPGAPVIYGGFTSNVDMRSGSPAFGTPEYTRAALAGGQLARRYDLPYRSSNVNAANAVDAQAAYESEMSLWGAVMGHANLVMHGAGWMEGGLTASFEKLVMDADLLQMMAETMAPITVDEASLGLDTIAEVGPGGHFFGTAHTLERYQTAFYEPLVSDWRNYEAWQEAGAPDTARRARDLVKRLLAGYETPPLDPGIREALDDFVERRKREGGAQAA